jgi:hypothetical protein
MAETVYDRILEGGTSVDGDDVPAEPVSIEITQLQQDPRKVTLWCDCGHEAVYAFKAAKRVVPLCSSSGCLRKALPKLEEWVKVAKSKSWALLSETNDILDPPKPKLKAKDEIRIFQQEQGIPTDGILGSQTEERLRDVGRGGMIPIWREKLKEEADE